MLTNPTYLTSGTDSSSAKTKVYRENVVNAVKSTATPMEEAIARLHAEINGLAATSDVLAGRLAVLVRTPASADGEAVGEYNRPSGCSAVVDQVYEESRRVSNLTLHVQRLLGTLDV